MGGRGGGGGSRGGGGGGGGAAAEDAAAAAQYDPADDSLSAEHDPMLDMPDPRTVQARVNEMERRRQLVAEVDSFALRLRRNRATGEVRDPTTGARVGSITEARENVVRQTRDGLNVGVGTRAAGWHALDARGQRIGTSASMDGAKIMIAERALGRR